MKTRSGPSAFPLHQSGAADAGPLASPMSEKSDALAVPVDVTMRRPNSERGGGKPMGRELIARLHRTKEDVPKNAISIDATAPVARVVDEIVRQSGADK